MTIHVKPEELIKIEEGTIFYRVRLQGKIWSPRICKSCKFEMTIDESSSVLHGELFKFNGETR